MGRNRFVDPGVTKIDLSDGDWIEVRDAIPFGMKQKLENAAIGGVHGLDGGDLAGARLEIDMAKYEIERILAWVTDWSFLSGDPPKPVALNRAAVERLTEEAADEIRAALDAHVARIEAGKSPATRTSAARASSP